MLMASGALAISISITALFYVTLLARMAEAQLAVPGSAL